MRDFLFQYLDKNYQIKEFDGLQFITREGYKLKGYKFLADIIGIFGLEREIAIDYLTEWLNINNFNHNPFYWDEPIIDWPEMIPPQPTLMSWDVVEVRPMSPPLGIDPRWLMSTDPINNNTDNEFIISEIRHTLSGETMVIDVDVETKQTPREININFILDRWREAGFDV